jgi:hypothetical protein
MPFAVTVHRFKVKIKVEVKDKEGIKYPKSGPR